MSPAVEDSADGMAACARCGMYERVQIDAAVARRRHQHHLRHRLLRDVAEVHQRPGLQPDGLDARLQLRCRRRAPRGVS